QITGNDTVSVMLSQPNGTYAAPVNYSIGVDFAFFNPQAPSLALADLTGTGKLDIIATHPFDNSFVVLANSGTGSFTVLQEASAGPAGNTSHAIAVGDFNGDGKIDLAIAETGANGVYIFTGNGDRTFGSPFFFPTVVATDVSPVDVAAADFNKDGNLDL